MSARVQSALPLADALQASEPLARLSERLRESNRRFACIQPALPGNLAAHAHPGPIDAQGWTLLADNAAVAAKLRQLVPRIDALLAEQNHAPLPLRVRVRTR
jgi:Dna[CI] antecedent, DciA